MIMIQIVISSFKAAKNLFQDWRKLDMRFKSLSFIGLVSVIALGVWGCMTTVQEDFVAAIEVHTNAIAKDYKRLLEDEDSTAFVAFKKLDDNVNGKPAYERNEFIGGAMREKSIKSRYRSVLELQRILTEAKAKKE